MKPLRELLLGAKLGLSGGRHGWGRTAMAAIGVGLGVALLLIAASFPSALQARKDRGAVRDNWYSAEERGPNTLLIASLYGTFRGRPVMARLIQPEGPDAPVPPGLSGLPGPGEMVVSPALNRLLASTEGALMRPRVPYRIVGIIGDEGLVGPDELAYYAGSDRLGNRSFGVARISAFGGESYAEPFSPMLVLLVIIVFVVLLLPVGVFIGAAVRFGGEHRDRRLAALRLVGADSRMARRIAAGEALLSAGLGVLFGLAFFAAGRLVVERFTLWDISVFQSDVRPAPALVGLVLVAVPAAGVGISLLALRRVVIEPLGVVRSAAGTRRRLWWRLIVPAFGAVLLYPLIGTVGMDGDPANQYQVVAGVVLLLIGVAALLPWLIEAVVRRVRGGAVPWQLAIRRLQLSSGTSARVVNGVAVAVAGAIALQMLFAAVSESYTRATGEDPSRAQYEADLLGGVPGSQVAGIIDRFQHTPGVTGVAGLIRTPVSNQTEGAFATLLVGDCSSLAELAMIGNCADGDVYLVGGAASGPRPGQRIMLGGWAAGTPPNHAPQWTIPVGAEVVPGRHDPMGVSYEGVLATPGAVDVSGVTPLNLELQLFLRVDPEARDAGEHIANTAATVDPMMGVQTLAGTEEARQFVNIRRGLYIGALAVLLLIGASLLVTTLEQLRERQRLLAVLVAFGTRRSTLSLSILWQTAVPVLLGLILAVIAGTGLGALLLAMIDRPPAFYWDSVVLMSGAAAGVVLLVTALSLPALWRLMRPDGLRTE